MGYVKESEALDKNGKPIDLYFFDDPMYHEDWHVAESLGVVLVAPPTCKEDNTWVFAMPEDKNRADEWLNT